MNQPSTGGPAWARAAAPPGATDTFLPSPGATAPLTPNWQPLPTGVTYKPHKRRWPWLVLVVLLLAGAGGAFVSLRTGKDDATKTAAPVKLVVHVSDRAEADPVNRLFSSISAAKFDAPLFLSAFDLDAEKCDTDASIASFGNEGAGASRPGDLPNATVTSTGTGTAKVAMGSLGFEVKRIHDRWLIERMVIGNAKLDGFTGSACDVLRIFYGARSRASARAAQSDLRNALTAEKTYYTDMQTYTSDAKTLHDIEPSLGWGTKVHVVVGDAIAPGDNSVVCISETATSGTTYALADVAAGPNAGTFFGTKACPAHATPAGTAALGTNW